MKNFWIGALFVVVCVANISVFGYFFQYLFASAFETSVSDARWVWLSALIAITVALSIVFLVRKNKKSPSRYILKIVAVIAGLSAAICGLIYGNTRYVSNYDNGFAYFHMPDGIGIVNRWGKLILEPGFNYVAVANYKPTNEKVLIGVNYEASGGDKSRYMSFLCNGDPVYISFYNMGGYQINYIKARYNENYYSFRDIYGEEYQILNVFYGSFPLYDYEEDCRYVSIEELPLDVE